MDMCLENLSNEEIADLIWEYYLRKQISYIEMGNLARGMIKEFGLNFFEEIPEQSIKLLMERGLVTKEYESLTKCDYLVFYSYSDEIRENIVSYKKEMLSEENSDWERKQNEKKVIDRIKRELQHYGRKTIRELQDTIKRYCEVEDLPMIMVWLLRDILSKCVNDGILERNSEDKKVYYSIKSIDSNDV